MTKRPNRRKRKTRELYDYEKPFFDELREKNRRVCYQCGSEESHFVSREWVQQGNRSPVTMTLECKNCGGYRWLATTTR